MPQDFVDIYDLYRDPISRYCTFHSHDRQVGEDLAQETFYRFWICMERHDPIRHVRGFLYHIAHNLIIDHVRRKKDDSLDRLAEEGFEPSVDTWHHIQNRMEAKMPLRILNAMPPTYSTALRYRYVDGLRPVEIAKLTGETPNAVSVRLFRGLRQLRVLVRNESAGRRRSMAATAADISPPTHE